MKTLTPSPSPTGRGEKPDYNVNIDGRNRNGSLWRLIFQLSTVIGVIALAALLLNISNSAF